MNFLTGKDVESTPAPKAPSAPSKKGGLNDIECFVDYVVRILVDKPEGVKVSIKEDAGNSTSVIEIVCAKEDMGKVIGKNGKTIMAIRSLASGAGGRLGQKVSVELIE